MAGAIKHVWALLLLAACATSDSPGQRGDPVEVPFILNEANVLVVEALFNDSDPIALMFHTAVDSVSLTPEGSAAAPSVRYDEIANVAAWGGSAQTRHSSGNRMSVGALSWEGLGITESAHSGRGTLGKVGWTLFEDHVIELDFERELIRLHAQTPSVSGGQRLTLEREGPSLFVEATVVVDGEAIPHRFLVHSGFSGSVLIDGAFAEAHGLAERLPVTPGRELRDSLGNVLVTRNTELPALRLGSIELRALPAELFPGAMRGQPVSILGADVLRRFRLWIDARPGDAPALVLVER